MFKDMWEIFRRTCIPHATSQEEIDSIQQVFYGGGVALMALLIENPSHTSQLKDELQSFVHKDMLAAFGSGVNNATFH